MVDEKTRSIEGVVSRENEENEKAMRSPTSQLEGKQIGTSLLDRALVASSSILGGPLSRP